MIVQLSDVYWTKIYPKVGRAFQPLSTPEHVATLPLDHRNTCDDSHSPTSVPKPIKVFGVLQFFSWFATKPKRRYVPFCEKAMLNPSLLQLFCNDECGCRRDFHWDRPAFVSWYIPSAITLYIELAE